MVKHTQTTRRQKLTNCFLSVLDHFVGLKLTLEVLNIYKNREIHRLICYDIIQEEWLFRMLGNSLKD